MPAYSNTATSEDNSGRTMEVDVEHVDAPGTNDKYMVDVVLTFEGDSPFNHVAVLDVPNGVQAFESTGSSPGCRWCFEMDPDSAPVKLKYKVKVASTGGLVKRAAFVVVVTSRNVCPEYSVEWGWIDPPQLALPRIYRDLAPEWWFRQPQFEPPKPPFDLQEAKPQA